MSPVHPVAHVPAPWTTKAECYWLLLNLKKLPNGVYDPLEADLAAGPSSADAFKGGLGIVMIVRYKDTPVGPYDELLLIPGNFTVPTPTPQDGPPKLPKKALRITRIYVSQRTTTYNGRHNWNIPKHLARFHFSALPTPAGSSPPQSLTISVYPPTSEEGDGVDPFFSVTLKPFRWIPAIPTSTRWLPLSTVHAQPPLPAAAKLDGQEAVRVEEGVGAYDVAADPSPLLVGTEMWASFPVHAYSPRARGCWVEVHALGSGEDVGGEGEREEAVQEAGKYWPLDVKPWRIGAWMEDAELIIPKPVEWKL